MVARPVIGRERVGVGPQGLDDALVLVLRIFFGAAEHHVFKKVCESGEARFDLVARARSNDGVVSDDPGESNGTERTERPFSRSVRWGGIGEDLLGSRLLADCRAGGQREGEKHETVRGIVYSLGTSRAARLGSDGSSASGSDPMGPSEPFRLVVQRESNVRDGPSSPICTVNLRPSGGT